MQYIAVETYGLCDFRGITEPVGSLDEARRLADEKLSVPPNPCYGFWGEDAPPIDPGTWLDVGQWMFAQDGLVYGQFKTKKAAESDRFDTHCVHANGRPMKREDLGSGPFYIGRVVKIHRRHNGCGVTQAILEV